MQKLASDQKLAWEWGYEYLVFLKHICPLKKKF